MNIVEHVIWLFCWDKYTCLEWQGDSTKIGNQQRWQVHANRKYNLTNSRFSDLKNENLRLSVQSWTFLKQDELDLNFFPHLQQCTTTLIDFSRPFYIVSNIHIKILLNNERNSLNLPWVLDITCNTESYCEHTILSISICFVGEN